MTSRNMNAMRDASALHDADEKRLPSSRGPYRSLGICADAEWTHPLKICKHSAMQQRAVSLDLESEQPIAERFSNQQFMGTCDRQSVRMRHIFGNGPDTAVRRRQEDFCGRKAVWTTRVHVKRGHIRVSVPSDRHVSQIAHRDIDHVGVDYRFHVTEVQDQSVG